MQRRQFLRNTATTAVVGSTGSLGVPADGGRAIAATLRPVPSPPIKLPAGTIDTSVYLGRWPWRRLAGDQTAELVTMLRNRGVAEAWAGSFDGLMQTDMAAVNDRLAEQCQHHGEGLLIPFGSINPMLPGWEEDLRRCHEIHRMPGIRLHPNYHRYGLEHPLFERLLRTAAEYRLIIQLATSMEEESRRSPTAPVAAANLNPLPELVDRFPDLQWILQNRFFAGRSGTLSKLVKAKNVYFETTSADAANPLGDLCQQTGAERILFGSCSPLSASGDAPLSTQGFDSGQIDAICRHNARRLFRSKS